MTVVNKHMNIVSTEMWLFEWCLWKLVNYTRK